MNSLERWIVAFLLIVVLANTYGINDRLAQAERQVKSDANQWASSFMYSDDYAEKTRKLIFDCRKEIADLRKRTEDAESRIFQESQKNLMLQAQIAKSNVDRPIRLR